MKKILILLFSIGVGQNLITNFTARDLLILEIESIKSTSIKDELYIKPSIQKVPNPIEYYNILNNLDINNRIRVEPVLGMRSSSSGFEMYINTGENIDNSAIPSSVIWLTPGIKIHSTIPLLTTNKSIWMYGWASFLKHSAYGFDDKNIYYNGSNLFNYNPEYSSSFYTGTVTPSKGGIDFDQSEGGVSILSENFKLIFGKYNTSIGPSSRSNLSISNTAPPFEQVLINYKYKKINFTYLFGKLDSNIPILDNPEHNLHLDQWEWTPNLINSTTIPEHSRYIAYHRIDILPMENLRIGFYEQVIFGGRDTPLSYLVPVLPFWSAQHELGDLDNVIMGIDIDYIKNYNRVYFSLLIDEWAPYSTFDDDERNWFAYQIGYSKYFEIFNKDCILKSEYTKIDPRVYNHRFVINEPYHHGYNLGYWSGRDSDDIYLSISSIVNDKSYINISYEFTRFSAAEDNEYIASLEAQYDDQNVGFLTYGYNSRKKVSLLYSVLLIKSIYCDVEFSSMKTSGLPYNRDEFGEFKLNLRYNIAK